MGPVVKMAEYKIKFEVFEGPLDLLLYLIKKEEVDIYEVNLTQLATQFIEYVDVMRMLDLEVAGAQRKPSRRDEVTGSKRRCNRGRANPRQPASSPSGPPTRLGMNSVRIWTSDDHCQRSMPDLVIKKAAVNAAISTADAPIEIPINRSGSVDHTRTALQLRSKLRWVTSAASVGPTVPSDRRAGEALPPIRAGNQRTRLMPYASKKYVVSSRRSRLFDSASALGIAAPSPLWQRMAPGGQPAGSAPYERIVAVWYFGHVGRRTSHSRWPPSTS